MQSFRAKVAIFAENKVKTELKKLVFNPMSRFKTVISSNFEELWRYNIVVVCELCSAEGERIEYKSKESFVAAVGSNLATPPIDYDSDREIVVESADGAYANILVYVIPHTLPSTNDVYKTKPFPLKIKIETQDGVIVNQIFKINQWSGDNIALKAESGKRRTEN